jgi:hypothetical protein
LNVRRRTLAKSESHKGRIENKAAMSGDQSNLVLGAQPLYQRLSGDHSAKTSADNYNICHQRSSKQNLSFAGNTTLFSNVFLTIDKLKSV